MISLRDYQLPAVEAIVRAKRGIIKAPAGSGKCLGKGTPVMMFDGSIKPVEQIIEGDRLMGPDSNPRVVRSVSTGREQLFRITPKKGEPFIVNESHILSLKVSGIHPREVILIPNSTQRAKNGDVVNICVRDFITSNNQCRLRLKAWRTAVDFQPVKLHKDMPPYLLGAWLGDGNSNGPGFSSADSQLVTVLSWHALRVGLDLREVKEEGKCPMYFLTIGKKAGRRKSNPFLDALRALNLLNNKHIPHAYLTASRHDRLELLAGLLDTDGSMARNGFDFISKNERISDGVCFLARSLGLAAYKKECTKTCVNNGKSGQYFRVSVSGDCSIIPCRIPRKRAAKRMQPKSVLVTGISVESIGEGEYFGFEIDGPDRLFLLGDFTVTHNTIIAAAAAAQWAPGRAKLAGRKLRIAWVAYTIDQIDQAKRALANFPDLAQSAEMTFACYHPDLRLEMHDLVIVDECHHIAAPEFRKALDGHTRTRWGFSATPEREDALAPAVFELLGDIVHTVERTALVEAGQLAKAKVIIHRPNILNEHAEAIDEETKALFTKWRFGAREAATDMAVRSVKSLVARTQAIDLGRLRQILEQANTTSDQSFITAFSAFPKGDERRSELWKMLTALAEETIEQRARWIACQRIGITANQPRNDLAVQVANKTTESHLMIVGSIEHGQSLSERIPSSVVVFSKMGPKKRREAIAAFGAGDLRTMIATSLADEGLDVPRASVLTLLSAGRSNRLAEQRTGRVLRSFHDKTHGTIHDFMDVQNPLLLSQSKKRISTYRSLGYEIITADTEGRML